MQQGSAEEKPVPATDLNRRANALARQVAASGRPVHVANYRKPWVQILPHDLAQRALEALAEKEAAAKA